MSDLRWIGPRRCEASACLQVARVEGGVRIRSSQRPDETLALDTPEWFGFLEAVRCGDFDEVAT